MDLIWKLLKEQPEPKKELQDTCSYCQSAFRLSEDGFYICSNSKCSIMVDHTIDTNPEWSFYDGDSFTSNPIRCGPPINKLLEESSIGCKILCSGKTTTEMRKIARFADWSMPYKEKTRYDDFMEGHVEHRLFRNRELY
jgi:transcription initiation factor TFIIIB Brf1 subunit/transcription initiation factor TFIIB